MSSMHCNRRRFLQTSSAGAAALSSLSFTPAEADEPQEADYRSDWEATPDRIWIGPEYWANPLQDWRVQSGRLECATAAPDRHVHLLTRELSSDPGSLRMTVEIGRLMGPLLAGRESAGFRVGIQGPLKDYRNSLLFGKGLNAGFTAEGRLFLGPPRVESESAIPADATSVRLELTVEPTSEGLTLRLAARDPQSAAVWAEVQRTKIPADQLAGNLALVANYPQSPPPTAARNRQSGGGEGFWFRDWQLSGTKVQRCDERAFGPILFSQYTLSRGVLKLTAQMPPLGEQDRSTVELELAAADGEWSRAGQAEIHPQARTATFRIEPWDHSREVRYRIRYELQTGDKSEARYWNGTIRRDPIDQPVITVSNVSCNTHAAFPNADYVQKLIRLNPDLVAFVGDQFYESSGGYGVVREPLEVAILDYLRKWYLHGWTWRELLRDRPSISLPDDHDVYQGNIWGEAGAPRQGTIEMGGYDMHPDWVNVVHRTHSSHHPDAADASPVRQGISVYYGPLTYGGISFAILADRMFKTGPEGVVPPTQRRGDHVTDPDFDPASADLPGAELLGERQMAFLRDWITDWREAEMKAIISQTIFTAMATTHGSERMRLRADYDANGWPQTPRNEALRVIRKAFAVHLAGDQHLPAVIQYGIEAHGDAPVAFAGPAVNVGYPRWWEPEQPGENRAPGAAENTGDFYDHFGHPLTILAVQNGVEQPQGSLLQRLNDRASGLGVVRFDKPRRQITFESWYYLADPGQDPQMSGWPVTTDMFANYGRPATAYLPRLQIEGCERPVVQVYHDATGELLYNLRLRAREFQPWVFETGTYTVRVLDPEQNRLRELPSLEARQNQSEVIRVALS